LRRTPGQQRHHHQPPDHHPEAISTAGKVTRLRGSVSPTPWTRAGRSENERHRLALGQWEGIWKNTSGSGGHQMTVYQLVERKAT
jgi:hypothetical protein